MALCQRRGRRKRCQERAGAVRPRCTFGTRRARGSRSTISPVYRRRKSLRAAPAAGRRPCSLCTRWWSEVARPSGRRLVEEAAAQQLAPRRRPCPRCTRPRRCPSAHATHYHSQGNVRRLEFRRRARWLRWTPSLCHWRRRRRTCGPTARAPCCRPRTLPLVACQRRPCVRGGTEAPTRCCLRRRHSWTTFSCRRRRSWTT
mmetsp:Transcript_73/g.214  ORF Transcript_73/g.214 Transcript_73/m.214 type:complete len:201 (+) Transcript_73:3168-3770(+)